MKFDTDASIASCRLATTARGRDKRGFVPDENAGVVALNEDARRYEQNRRTFQSILLGICGPPLVEHPISWEIVAEEAQFAAALEGVSATDVFRALENDVTQLVPAGRPTPERKTGLPRES